MTIAKQLEERGLWWHWQNLNEDKSGRPKGKPWSGRVWFHWKHRTEVRIEWHIGLKQVRLFGFEVQMWPSGAADEDVTLSLHTPIAALYLSLNSPLTDALVRRLIPEGYDDRTIALELSASDGSVGGAGTIRWMLWMPDCTWRSTDPKWRRGYWNPIDTIFGRYVHTQEHISLTDTVVPLSEGNYSCTVEMYRSIWRRPRWPIAKTIIRANVEMAVPIPIPGKGENSWDIEDDATYSVTLPADSPEDAVLKVAASIQERRERHGGPDWVPDAGWPVGVVNS